MANSIEGVDDIWEILIAAFIHSVTNFIYSNRLAILVLVKVGKICALRVRHLHFYSMHLIILYCVI